MRYSVFLYVGVYSQKRDEVVMALWQMLNYMKQRHIDLLEDFEEEKHLNYPSLEGEVVKISKTIDYSQYLGASIAFH